jgi:hypothetical protein
MRPAPRLILVAAACLAAVGCAGPAPSVVTVRTPLVDAGEVSPIPTPDPTAVADTGVFGRWRRAPVTPSRAVAHAAETACRAQDGVGQLPMRVLDARGEGLLTLIFADDATTLACHAAVADDGTVIADVRAVEGLADAQPPAEGHLGAHDMEIINGPSGARVVIVGRVADVPEVGISFDDSTWGKATIADGWYAAWWPQASVALSVASVDRRSVVIDSFPVVP